MRREPDSAGRNEAMNLVDGEPEQIPQPGDQLELLEVVRVVVAVPAFSRNVQRRLAMNSVTVTGGTAAR
jgi:hypothetical protein